MTIMKKQMMVTLWTAGLSRVSSRNFSNFRQYKLLKQWEKHFSQVASSQRPLSLFSPPSSNDTFISQNLFPLSWLAAPFPSFCVGTKFSSEATVIVFHLGRLKALQASPGGTGGDGKNGEEDRKPRPRPGTKDPWPIYHDALLRSSGIEVNLPFHNFVTHIRAQICSDTRSHYRRPILLSCVLKLPHTSTTATPTV